MYVVHFSQTDLTNPYNFLDLVDSDPVLATQHIHITEGMAKVSEICGILDGLKKSKREGSISSKAEKRKLKAIKIDLEPFRWHEWYQQIWDTIWEFPNLKPPEDKPDEDLKVEQDPDYFIYETGSEASSSHQMDEYSEEDEGKKICLNKLRKQESANFHFFFFL